MKRFRHMIVVGEGREEKLIEQVDHEEVGGVYPVSIGSVLLVELVVG